MHFTRCPMGDVGNSVDAGSHVAYGSRDLQNLIRLMLGIGDELSGGVAHAARVLGDHHASLTCLPQELAERLQHGVERLSHRSQRLAAGLYAHFQVALPHLLQMVEHLEKLVFEGAAFLFALLEERGGVNGEGGLAGEQLDDLQGLEGGYLAIVRLIEREDAEDVPLMARAVERDEEHVFGVPGIRGALGAGWLGCVDGDPLDAFEQVFVEMTDEIGATDTEFRPHHGEEPGDWRGRLDQALALSIGQACGGDHLGVVCVMRDQVEHGDLEAKCTADGIYNARQDALKPHLGAQLGTQAHDLLDLSRAALDITIRTAPLYPVHDHTPLFPTGRHTTLARLFTVAVAGRFAVSSLPAPSCRLAGLPLRIAHPPSPHKRPASLAIAWPAHGSGKRLTNKASADGAEASQAGQGDPFIVTVPVGAIGLEDEGGDATGGEEARI